MGQTAAGSVVGTAAYMSPEQARAEEVDYRSDQFSLGLVLYEMLSGRQAFSRPSAVQTMSAIVEDEPAPLERAIPAQLRWILERCLAKDRESRYESTRDLARELAQLRDHYSELTAATTSTQLAVASRPQRRVKVPVLVAAVAAGAIAAWCAARLLDASGGVDISRYNFTPFATALTQQYSPAWSPDGKSIAFLGRLPSNSNKAALYVQAVNAASAVAISNSDAEVFNSAPFWSPDSRTIFYRCGIGPRWGLCRIPAGGGASSMVQEHETGGAISPDGRTLVTFTYPDAKVWVISPIGSAPREYLPAPVKIDSYYNSPSLAFAPDGKKILFAVALKGRGETSWLLPWPPGPSRRVFEATSEFAFTPQWKWLPDSRHLVFADAGAASCSRTYMADVATGRYWPELVQDCPASSPTVSPDGSRIAYVSDLSHAEIVEAPVDGEPSRTLVGGTRSQQQGDLSGDGKLIVYHSSRRGPEEIWITSLTEHWDRVLASPADLKADGQTPQFLMDPTFSKDGQRVAFSAKLPDSIRIYTVFTSGGTPVEATADRGAFEMMPAWSPDGNWLAYASLVGNDSKLMKVRPGSGEQPVTIGTYGGPSMLEWSPTGEWIACHRGSDNTLVLVSPDGKTVREFGRHDGPVAWSRDGKTLYEVQADPPALLAFDVPTSQSRKLRDLEMPPFASTNPGVKAALAPDGKTIVYSVNRARQEIWILDGVKLPRPWYRKLLP
jgi:Tol biopolymer transport system component